MTNSIMALLISTVIPISVLSHICADPNATLHFFSVIQISYDSFGKLRKKHKAQQAPSDVKPEIP